MQLLFRLTTVRARVFLMLVALARTLAAQAPQPPQGKPAGTTERGVMVRVAQIYLSPDTSSEKLAQIERGREVAVLERGSGQWLHVLATLKEDRELGDKDVTGWILDKGVIRASTPNGDRIVFGEAVNSEAEASRRGGRKGADRDAMRLYYRTWEYFPNSPVAGEALYRAADIRWQLDRADVMGRPSARRSSDPNERFGMDEEWLRQVMKKFPRTRWADLAAFDLIDNKLYGDWQGLSKCPQREADTYEKYAEEHPQSPKLQEALYEAARRRAALIELYKTEGQTSKSGEARQKALSLAQRIIAANPQSDWAMRAQCLAYMVEQQIPVYGNAVD